MKTSSIKEVIEDSISFSLRGSKATCQISLPDDLWPVDIDAGQVGQVISNLIINAVQAMSEGGVIQVFAENITIGSKDVPSLKSGDYVKTTVVDHGCGISKEHIHLIFDPYFTTKEKGSGLGLAVCFSIIKCHGGYISVDSEVGVGTTFHFYIPKSDEQVQVKDDKQESLVMGKGRILIMDDEVQIRYTTGQLLRNIGYDVEVCREGQEAIRLYRSAKEEERSFDAVILDLTIPGGLGGEVVVKRLLEIDPDVKAIVSSGYSNDPILSNSKGYGFCGCLSKPFEIKELNKVLRDVITGEDG
jgi:CheY-like chemotaxis protein